MSSLITIDPGVHEVYWAYFVDGFLKAIGECAPDKVACTADRAIIEFPRVYPGVQEKPPNDLIDLAGLGAGTARGALLACSTPVELVYPRSWKGQAVKPIHHGRIWNQLTEKEREVISIAVRMSPEQIAKKIRAACDTYARTRKVSKYSWKAHNFFDAVGIGVWSEKDVRQASRVAGV